MALAISTLPLARQDRAGACWHLHRFPDAGGHAPADQLVALAHRAWLRVALRPAEPFRTLAVAFAQLLAAVGLVLDLVLVRVIDQPQLERIEAGRISELVHRAFDRVEAFRAARRPHVARRVLVELDELLGGFDVGAAVELARPPDAIALEILELRGHADERVAECGKAAVTIGRQRQRLDVGGAVAEREHLLAGQRHLHRALERPCGENRKRQLVLRPQS